MMIKRIAIAAALLLAMTAAAAAQCTGSFLANQFCGSLTGGTPGPRLISSSVINMQAGTVLGNPGVAAAAGADLHAAVLGLNGTAQGSLGLRGSGTGTVTIQPGAAAAGTYNFNLPIAAGSAGLALLSGGGGAAAQTYAILGLPAGGTNAALTASNGGLVYSDASALAILAGTATAGQIPLSGASAAPSWSTATYPATATQGSILAAGTANVISATPTPVLGIPGTTMGTLRMAGSGSGTVTITPQASAGTITLTLPNTSGTFAAGASSPLVLSATTGNLTCPTCFLTSGGQALTKTDDTNVTLTLGGSPTTALVNAASITAGWTGQLSPARGGTGVNNTATSDRYLKGNGTGFATSSGAASGTGACGAGDFVRVLNSDAAPTCATPAGGGTVTSVVGNGVTITSTGTVPPPYGLVNHSIAVSAAGSALTIALKDNAGSDPSATSPVNGYFRNVTTTVGSTTQLTVTGALSLVVSSGSTLGVTSSTAFRLWVVLFNDGGTARLGVINCASVTGSPSTAARIFPLVQGQVASSTAEGGAGAADSAGVFYTGTAVTSKAYLIVGYVEWSATGLTAGTWTTSNLLYIQSFGPGIYKPGDVVQTLQMSTATSTAVTSSTYQDTATTQAITPISAANFVRVVANGTGSNGNAALTSLFATIFRDATQLTPQFNGTGSTGVVGGTAAFDWLDNPNSISSVTYMVKIKNDDNLTTVRFPVNITGATGQMALYEIMR